MATTDVGKELSASNISYSFVELAKRQDGGAAEPWHLDQQIWKKTFDRVELLLLDPRWPRGDNSNKTNSLKTSTECFRASWIFRLHSMLSLLTETQARQIASTNRHGLQHRNLKATTKHQKTTPRNQYTMILGGIIGRDYWLYLPISWLNYLVLRYRRGWDSLVTAPILVHKV